LKDTKPETSLPQRRGRKKRRLANDPKYLEIQMLSKRWFKRRYQKSVYRFKTSSVSSKIPSPTVALEFTGCAPSEIAFHGMKVTPRPYVPGPGPPRCSKRCQRLGHTSNHCKEEVKCNNCGTAHDDMANCTAPPRCINCEGNIPRSPLLARNSKKWKWPRTAPVV
jgi:hypothetical protein